MISGTPCQDWSTSGSRLGREGPTQAVWLAWVLVGRHWRPKVILHENVQGMPESMLWECFADLYLIFSFAVCTSSHGAMHVSRKRRYTIMYLRSKVARSNYRPKGWCLAARVSEHLASPSPGALIHRFP